MTLITTTVANACKMTGLGKTKIYELMNQGMITSVTVGRRRLVKVDSLHALLEQAA